MEPVTARWEWRTFGTSFGPAEPHLAAASIEKVQESEEDYLLAAGSDANVKIRDGLMDIKHLEHVDANSLEQWRPVLKASFPLDAGTLASVRQALGLPASSTAEPPLLLDDLPARLAPAGGPVRLVHVRKTRARFHVQSCVAERTEVLVDGARIRTVAIEDADPAKVIAAVRAMGLDGFPNVSYPRGLRQVLDAATSAGSSDREAVIDVGTNSVKFHVAERRADGVWVPVVDRAEVTRLGEGLDQGGSITPAAIERTTAAIEGMAAEAARLGSRHVTAVGTMGLRTASNAREVLDAIRKRSGVAVEVIDGEAESRIAYLAVQSSLGLADEDLVIFDTGGGSSQFTFGHGPRVDRRFSVDVGAVRFTDRFHLDQAVSEEVLAEALAAIAAELSALDGVRPPAALVGMGGAVTNLTAVMLGMAKYDPDRVQGAVLERAEVDRQIGLYRARSADERRQIVGLQPKRAEVILAGACIVRTILDKLGKDRLSVSDRGLRHGVLIDHFGGSLARAGTV